MAGEPKEVDERWWREGAEGALPLGAPFRPGLDPIPALHEVWAVVKDRWGRPAHGEPGEALRQVVTPVPEIGISTCRARGRWPSSPRWGAR
jgi:hypothetical protein